VEKVVVLGWVVWILALFPQELEKGWYLGEVAAMGRCGFGSTMEYPAHGRNWIAC
jgi:hypothetical protein